MNTQEVTLAMADFRSKRVGHRIAKETRNRLVELLLTTERERVIALIGPAGVGKTAVLARACQMLIEEYRDQMLQDPGFLPYVSVTTVTGLNGDYSWKDGFARLLVAGKEPLLGKKIAFPTFELDGQAITTTRGLIKDEFRRAFESMVKHRKVRVIFLDEGSAIIDETVNRHPLRQFNILKSLAVELGIIIVLIGAYDLIGLNDGNGQLIRRVDCIHMPRYLWDLEEERASISHEPQGEVRTDFAEFSLAVDTLASAAPVKVDSEALADKRFVILKSVGCVGNFRNWFDRSCVDALLHNGGVLSKVVMERNAMLNSTLTKLTMEAQLGEQLIAEPADSELAALHGLSSLRSPDSGQTGARVKPRKKQGPVAQRKPSRDVAGGLHA